MPFRLCIRAPRTVMWSMGMKGKTAVFSQNDTTNRLRGVARGEPRAYREMGVVSRVGERLLFSAWRSRSYGYFI